MIVRDRPGLFQVIFTIRGSILQRIYPQIILVMALSCVVVWAHWEMPSLVPVFNGAPFALLGVALSIFLGFRNSACYDRWWEARKHWGQLVATCRDLSRQSLLLDERGAEASRKRREMLHLTIAFTHALVLGWTTPIAAAVFAYTFFGLDALGDELEEPFGSLPNDLPIRAIAVNIEISIRDALGDEERPKPLAPSNYVLL